MNEIVTRETLNSVLASIKAGDTLILADKKVRNEALRTIATLRKFGATTLELTTRRRGDGTFTAYVSQMPNAAIKLHI
jgi:hypothetical protein